jgi:hypothetical protein
LGTTQNGKNRSRGAVSADGDGVIWSESAAGGSQGGLDLFSTDTLDHETVQLDAVQDGNGTAMWKESKS